MPSLQDLIREKFIETLRAADAIPKPQIDRLQELLDSGKKVKADDLVTVFTAPLDAEIK